MLKIFDNSKNLIFLILAIIFLFFIPKIIGILLLFFAAYVLAAALNPYVNKLQKKMSRGLATSVVIISSIFIVIALFVPIFVIAFKEIRAFIAILPQKIEAISEVLISKTINGQNLSDFFRFDNLFGASPDFAQNLFSQSLNITIGAAELCVWGFAITMIVFYILVDKIYLRNKFLEFFPPNLKDKASSILTSITFKVGSYIRAQVLSMIAVGVLVTIFLAIIGVEYSLLLGLISGILDIIPILGPTIALAVIVLVAAPLGWVKILLAIIAFLLVQQISNYIVRPFLFGKFMSLHPLMVFFALFVAQKFLGIWGVILSPAIAATVCVLIDELYLIPINRGKDFEI